MKQAMQQIKKHKILCMALCLFALISFLPSCSKYQDPHTETGFYFDTVIQITLYGNDKRYMDECFELCDKYEKLFSTEISDSDVSKINSSAGTGLPVVVNPDTFDLIEKSITYSELSKGKFDITIGKLTKTWNFDLALKSPEKYTLPSQEKIDTARISTGYENLVLNRDDFSVYIRKPGVSIDLGGTAKGYIADKLKEYLSSVNVKKGMINLGGNVLLLGSKPYSSNYNIGIKKPFSQNEEIIAAINTSDKSIVTSGIYERSFTIDEKFYHHILDTDTGYPVQNEILSVTIISDKSMDGDALSTSVLILGLTDGLKLIESLEDTEAVIITSDNKLHYSSGLKQDKSLFSLK